MSVSAQGCQKRRVGFLGAKITGGCKLPDLMMKKELRSSGRTILKLLNHLSIARIEVLKSAGGGEQNTCNTSTDEEVVCKRRGGDIRMGAEE